MKSSAKRNSKRNTFLLIALLLCLIAAAVAMFKYMDKDRGENPIAGAVPMHSQVLVAGDSHELNEEQKERLDEEESLRSEAKIQAEEALSGESKDSEEASSKTDEKAENGGNDTGAGRSQKGDGTQDGNASKASDDENSVGNGDTSGKNSDNKKTGGDEDENSQDTGKQEAGTVTVSLDCRNIGLGFLFTGQEVKIYEGDKLSAAIVKAIEANGYTCVYAGTLDSGFYLKRIKKTGMMSGWTIPDNIKEGLEEEGTSASGWKEDSLGEKDIYYGSGWMYEYNGEKRNSAMSSIKAKDGDYIRVWFTTHLGEDYGGE